jgi:MFS family permease
MGLLPDGDLTAPVPTRLTDNLARPSRHITLATAIRHPAFWLLAAGFGCAPLSTSAVLTHQVAFMTDAGLGPASAAFFAGLVGLGGATGRVVIPALSDRIGRVAAYGLSTASLIIGIGSLFLGGHTGALPFFYLYAIAMGCGYGPPGPIFAVATADVFSGKSFGAIYGLIRIGMGIGGAIGPWLAGYIFDSTGAYDYALLIAVVAAIIAWLCLAATRIFTQPAQPLVASLRE